MGITSISALPHFILRSSMYIGEANKSSVSGFIIGYQMGLSKHDKINITDLIAQHLEKEHNIENWPGCGWVCQIEKYSEKNNLSWYSSFQQISILIWTQQANEGELKEFSVFFKTVVHGLVRYTNDENIDLSNSNQWKGIINLNENWFTVIWNKDELELLEKMYLEMMKIYSSKIGIKKVSQKFKQLQKEFEKHEDTDYS